MIKRTPEIHQEAVNWATLMMNRLANNISIINKSGELVKLVPNFDQRNLLYWIGCQVVAKLPVRIQVLKYRRGGFSTCISALFYDLCNAVPHQKALSCAHDSFGTDTLWSMVNLMHDHTPEEIAKTMRYSSRKELVWATPHRSSFQFHTAGAKELARSKECRLLHLSEVAFYPHAEQTLVAVKQTLSDQPGTICVEESTANGASGPFYDAWIRNVKFRRKHPDALDGTIPLFFGWLSCPEYAMEPPAGVEIVAEDSFEHELVRLGATVEQLWWRRMTLADKCNGDPEKFCQEYPATPDEAFRTSGRPALSQTIIKKHESTCREPDKKIVFCKLNEEIQYVDADGDEDCWWIWEEPKPGAEYAVFGDVAEGEVSDKSNPKSDPDYHGGFVLNRRNMEQVAEYRGRRLDAYDYGEQLLYCAKWYNNAWATPEANAAGQAALRPFKDDLYETLFIRNPSIDSEIEDDLPRYGWKTDRGNRDDMIDMWLLHCRPHPVDLWKGRITIHSRRLVGEERTFVRKPSGRREHSDGAHDDILFAAFGALQLHLRCPIEPLAPVRELAPATPSYMYVGGVDKEPEKNDDQETTK